MSESQTQIELEKGMPKLPSLSDIHTLNQYVLEKRDDAFKKLSTEFDYTTWLELGRTTLISILLFNRKRPGELSRIKLLPFVKNREDLKLSNPEYYNKLSEPMKKIADKYIRVLIRGKKNAKITPVLLDRRMLDCAELFISYRDEAGINIKNPYVFALPDSFDGFKWIEASPLLQKYSENWCRRTTFTERCNAQKTCCNSRNIVEFDRWSN